MFTGVVTLGESNPSSHPDPSGDGGGDGVGHAAADQEEEELGVVLEGVLVRALKVSGNNCDEGKTIKLRVEYSLKSVA